MINKLWVVSLIWGIPVFGESLEGIVPQVGISVKNHLLITSRKDAEDKSAPATSELLDSTTIGANYSTYDLNVNFAHKLSLDNKPSTNKPFVLEKKSVSADWGRWAVKLGDSHQELGKGIALSLYQDDVFGVNNTLEGGHVAFHGKDVEAEVFGGRLNAVQAPIAVNPQEYPLKDRTVYLIGGQGKVNVSEDVKLGLHYLFSSNRNLKNNKIDRAWNTIGASTEVENLAENVDLYAETNVLLTRLYLGRTYQDLPWGYGSYMSMTWAEMPWRVKLEGKDYRGYNYEFRRPPTLEEDVVETTNIVDVSALKLATERKIALLSASIETSMLMGYDRLSGAPVYHGVVGTRFTHLGPAELELKGGYRDVPARNHMVHFGGKAKIKTFKGQMVELGGRKQLTHDKLNLLPTVDDRNLFDLTYSFSETLNVTLGYEYVPTNDLAFGHHFASVGAGIRWGANAIKGFVGRTSGGTVCSGGICRRVPPYDGAMVESVFSL